jgi:allantoinase
MSGLSTRPRTVLTPPAGSSPMSDIPNRAWHEYGNRVGFWRMLEVLYDFAAPAVLAINGPVIESCRAIAEAALERDWKFNGHGLTQKNTQKVEDEPLDMARSRRSSGHLAAGGRAVGSAPA